ncbi:HAD-IA family hydrolase [Microbacterium marinilacus]|nr:HAD-IA family hydrolase [Microbacterium marinilacus]
MDGTLVDSTGAVEAVWTEVASVHGLDVGEILAVAHGMRASDTIRRFLPAHQVDDAVSALEAQEIATAEGTLPIPGALAYVAGLRERGVPVAVVTSASRPLAEARLRAVGLPEPDVLVTAGDVLHGKPAPDGYLLAAERLGVDPRGCCVFEDAEAGVHAGLSSGATVIVVGGWDSPATLGLRRIRDYEELLLDPASDPLAP